jgi:hypothetical protein
MQVLQLFELVFDVRCALALSERFAAKALGVTGISEIYICISDESACVGMF